MGYFNNSSIEAESAFYGAFENLDLDLMKATWYQGGDIFCIHPGGPIQKGYGTVLKHWEYLLQGSHSTPINYRVVSRIEQQNMAVHLVEERIGGNLDGPLILATNTYIKTDNGWRLYSHHASLPLPEKSSFSGDIVH